MSPLVSKTRVGTCADSPLLFLVHGRAGSLTVMSTFARTVPDDWHIVFVEAPVVDPIGGFSWWDISNSIERDAQRSNSLEMLTSFISNYAATAGITPRKVFAFGFSQGAALLSVIMQKTPRLITAVALLSGFVIQQDVIGEGPLPAVFIAHGTDDQVITIEHALEGVRFLEENGFVLTIETENIGHKVGIHGMRALKAWVAAQSA